MRSNRLDEKVNRQKDLTCEDGARFQSGIKLKDLVYIDLQGLLIEVPGTGFEPAQPFGCCHLKTVRLPISPPGRVANIRTLCFSDKLLSGWSALHYVEIVDKYVALNDQLHLYKK